MSKLFSPIRIKGLELKNRIVVSPMCQYSSVDGFANDWHFVHLGSRAVGGASLVIIEATAVSPEGRISPQDLGIWKDEHINKLSHINAFMKAQGAATGIQLAHAGRKASTKAPWLGRGSVAPVEGGWQTFAPSDLAYSTHYPEPAVLDEAGLAKILNDFREAANRAVQAGFQVVEIHASHGYLLHQFLSPLSNHRTDGYGGSFENRIRLLLEVVKTVKSQLPDHYPLFARIPGTDWADGGWSPDDAVRLAGILMQEDVDVLDVTSGGLVPQQQIQTGPAYQLPFASRVKRETGALVSTVGLITNAAQAESILINGDADLIMMARELLRDPYFPLKAAQDLGDDLAWPVQYERAKM